MVVGEPVEEGARGGEREGRRLCCVRDFLRYGRLRPFHFYQYVDSVPRMRPSPDTSGVDCMAKRALAYVVSLTLEGELRESCLLTKKCRQALATSFRRRSSSHWPASLSD